MSIPYTIDRRPDTGVTNVTMGIWLFLASEVMLFGALFSAYALLRVSAPSWPSGRDILSLRLGITNTIILFAMTSIVWRGRTLRGIGARRALMLGSLLALAFLGVKGVEYYGEITSGMRP